MPEAFHLRSQSLLKMKELDPSIVRLVLWFLAVGTLDTMVTGSLLHWIPLIAGIVVGLLVAKWLNE